MKKLINQRFIDAVNFVISEKIETKKSEIAKNLNISSSKLSEILNKRMNVGVDAIALLSDSYNISTNRLLLGKGDFIQSNNSEKINKSPNAPQVITVTSENEDNIVLVPVKAQAGYLAGYDDPQFIQELPSYNLPNMRNGIFRMFQVKGHSMYPTMHSNSYVVGQFVENWVNDIKDNRIYVIVSENDGVVVKRVLNRIEKYNNLYCKSDNRKEYPSFSIEPKDIREVWECKMLLSYEFLDPAEIYDKVNDLEAEMLHLKHLYSKSINKNNSNN